MSWLAKTILLAVGALSVALGVLGLLTAAVVLSLLSTVGVVQAWAAEQDTQSRAAGNGAEASAADDKETKYFMKPFRRRQFLHKPICQNNLLCHKYVLILDYVTL